MSIKINEVTLTRRGRGEPVKAKVIGLVKHDDKDRASIDTTVLRGMPIIEILNLGQERGFDPSEMAAIGYNVMAETEARGGTTVNFGSRLMERGLADTPESARLMTMHLRALGKRSGITDDTDLLDLAAEMAERGKRRAG